MRALVLPYLYGLVVGKTQFQVPNFLEKIQTCFLKRLCFCPFQVGGKKFEQSMKNVDEFVNKLCSFLSNLGFNRTVAFIDENFTAYEK